MKISFRRALQLLLVAVVVTVATRYIVSSPYRDTSLFYIGTPFLISLAIYWSAPRTASAGIAKQTLGRHMLEATLVFLQVTLFMFEGFLCVLFSTPIYFTAVCFGYLTCHTISGAIHRKRNRVKAYTLPLVAVILSLEGVSAATTLDRENRATYTTTVNASIGELKANMARPISFDKSRPWFVSLFPSPVSVKAGSLNVGDMHRIGFAYRKWFFTNVHEGEMWLRISSIGEDYVETTIVDNSSYLASYMSIDGTRVQFTELGSGQTEIALTVFYRRKLDPVWYFGPLQRLAMNESAQYLVETVIARNQFDG